MEAKTQLEKIKSHLKRFKSISTWEAIKHYRITRLSQYILLLRKEGVKINSIWVLKNKKRFVIYSLNN